MTKRYSGIKAINGKRCMVFTDGSKEYISEITEKISRAFKSDNRELKEFFIKKHCTKAIEIDLVVSI